jgi:hypothetical protein
MSRKQRGAVLAAVALAVVASLVTLGFARDGGGSAEAQPGSAVKWVQRPDTSPYGLDVGTLDPVHVPLVLADDFQCSESGLITQIDFWASWYHDAPPGGDPSMVQFILSLHKDVPAGVDQPWSHPGDLLWMYYYPAGACVVQPSGMGQEGWFDPFLPYYDPFADTMIWLYTCPIPAPYFQQAKGTIYWLDVQAMPMGGMFGWKTSLDKWNDDGVWSMGMEPIPPLSWLELRYPSGHPLSPQSIDLAFEIWGQPCSALLDTDLDGFNDAIECYLPTDRSDNCTNNPGVHDAWPLDINIDTFVTVGGDILPYRGNIGLAVPPGPQRLDLNMDGVLTVGGDVLPFRGRIGASCT